MSEAVWQRPQGAIVSRLLRKVRKHTAPQRTFFQCSMTLWLCEIRKQLWASYALSAPLGLRCVLN